MFLKLKYKMEERRNSSNFFWKFVVQVKDFLWKIQYKSKGVFIWVGEVLKAKPKSKMKYVYRRLKHYNLPMWERLEIDLHSFCNRDCAWCPRHNDRSGIRKDGNGNKVRKTMPIEKVYDLIDQASRLGFNGRIGFHRLSEALLDPRFLEAWKYARSKGMKLDNHTNGDVLKKNPELCSELDESGNRLTIGLYDCDTHKKREEEINFWKNKFLKAEVMFSEPLRGNLALRQNAQIYELTRKDPEEVNRPCFTNDSKNLLIRYDGNISFCCQDDQCTFNLGNVFKQSIEEVWWSDRRAEVRKTLGQPGGRHQFDLCKNCYALQRINDGKRLSFIADWIKQHS